MPYRPGPAGLDQVCAGQLVQQTCRPRRGGAGQRGGGVAVEDRAPGAGPQPEHPRGPGVQVPVGPGEHGPHAVRGSPPASSTSSRCCWSPARWPGRRASRRADGGELGGDPQRQRQPRHRAASSAAAPGSASTRPPISARSNPTASGIGSRSRSTGCAPSLATRPASVSRLVTTTTQPGLPGSSGRTCSAAAALSR